MAMSPHVSTETTRLALDSSPVRSSKALPEILYASQQSALELAALYSDLVERVDQLMSAAQRGERELDLEGVWATALKLVPHIGPNPRVLLGLAARDADDQCLARHAANVFILTMKTAEPMPLSPGQRTALGQAALFHDMGKALLPGQILECTGPLSCADQLEMVRHPLHSDSLLEGLDNELARVIVRQSHERADGLGYPAGLVDDQIHHLAKLLAAVNAFDAMSHKRPHRPARTPFEAMGVIRADAGTHFDIDALRALLRTVTPYPVGSLVRLSTGKIAKVIDVRAKELVRPAVAVLTDSAGFMLPRFRYLDLRGCNGVYIQQAVVDEQLTRQAREVF